VSLFGKEPYPHELYAARRMAAQCSRLVQGTKDEKDALSVLVIFRKRAMFLVAFFVERDLHLSP